MHNSRHHADKRPTLTSRVERLLCETDDFMRLPDIAARLSLTRHQVDVTLHHLKHWKAVDAMEVDGTLWWYATPGDDRRAKKIEERKPEQPGSRGGKIIRDKEFGE